MGVINDRIKKRRTDLGLTLLEVADALGVKEATAQRYESGAIKSIGHDTISKLSEILHCSPSYLMGWEDTASVISSTVTPSAKEIIISEYGPVVFDSVKLFIQLDAIDQGSILERMRMFLEQDKYSRQKGVLDA